MKDAEHIIDYYFEKAKTITDSSVKDFFEEKVKYYISLFSSSRIKKVYEKDKANNTITGMVLAIILNKFLQYVTLRMERPRIKVLYHFSPYNFKELHESLLFHTILDAIPYPIVFKRAIEDSHKTYLLTIKRENFGNYTEMMDIMYNLLFRHNDGFFFTPLNVIIGRSLHIYRGYLTENGVTTIINKYSDVYDSYLFYYMDYIAKNLFIALPESSFKERILPIWTTYTFILKDGKLEIYCPYCDFYPACARKNKSFCFNFFKEETKKHTRSILVENFMEEIQQYVGILFKDLYFNGKWKI